MKTMVINRFNGKNNTIYLPASATVAETFAQSVLEGEVSVYEQGTSIGTSDVATSALDTSVMVRNTTTNQKTYMNLLVKPTVTEEQIYTALVGLTIDGIVVDRVHIVGQREVTF